MVSLSAGGESTDVDRPMMAAADEIDGRLHRAGPQTDVPRESIAGAHRKDAQRWTSLPTILEISIHHLEEGAITPGGHDTVEPAEFSVANDTGCMTRGLGQDYLRIHAPG